MTDHQKTDFDRGWAAGVIFAAAFIAGDHRSPSIAEDLLDVALTDADLAHGDGIDIQKLRDAKVRQFK
jgi:hypothetical protein